jgi:Xaa-Pro aminopeptidase
MGIPEDVQKAFAAVRGALLAGAKALKPGVEGWRVDDAARTYLTSVGYPEYPHALGHNLGRMAHDGGGILGPRWPRYGDRPYVVVEPGNVFTLELGTKTSRGYIGLEEDVVVTETGCEFLSKPQTEISIIPWGD